MLGTSAVETAPACIVTFTMHRAREPPWFVGVHTRVQPSHQHTKATSRFGTHGWQRCHRILQLTRRKSPALTGAPPLPTILSRLPWQHTTRASGSSPSSTRTNHRPPFVLATPTKRCTRPLAEVRTVVRIRRRFTWMMIYTYEMLCCWHSWYNVSFNIVRHCHVGPEMLNAVCVRCRDCHVDPTRNQQKLISWRASVEFGCYFQRRHRSTGAGGGLYGASVRLVVGRSQGFPSAVGGVERDHCTARLLCH